MTRLQPPSPYRSASRLLTVGAALTIVGGAIGLTGAAVTVAAATIAARRRIELLDTPPSELARRHWRRARTAVSAGAGVWRNGHAEVPPAMPFSEVH